jgi:uncharacterized YigZ family protein
MFDDRYKTINVISEGLFKAQGSRFISYAIPVKKEKEVKKHLDNLQNKHHDARHLCFAYQLGFDKSVYRISDGGEPSGTAGKQIFGQIRSKDLTNILIVVVRYFGGIKLGIHGLINAFRTASKNALDNATIITKTVNDVYEICYDYADMNNVMKILKDNKIKQLSHKFELACKITFLVRKNDSNKIYEIFKKTDKLNIKYLYTE